MILRHLKKAIRTKLLEQGIEVRKAPGSFEALPVFPLVVEAVMARRGRALRFVQIGANDGVFGDPLRSFILSCGWTGVLVEPQADVFKRLCANYAECAGRLTFENIAISRSDTVTLYLPPQATAEDDIVYAQSVVSSSADVIAHQVGVSKDQLRRVEVPGMTLDALFAKHGITELDLLQIDCEGYDWEVLQTLDLGKVKPLLIQLETGHMHRLAISIMAKRLNEMGYLIHYAGWQGDTIALRKDVMAMPRL